MTTPTTAQRLAAEGIADYAQDLRQLSAEKLPALFAFASSGKINDGRRAPIAGNLRSLALYQHSCHQPQSSRAYADAR